MEVKEPSAKYLARSSTKQSAIGLIPAEWEVKSLGEVAEIRSGIAKNSGMSVSNPVLVHYLRVANVQDGFLDLSEMSMIRVCRDDVGRYAVLPGDMLMNEGGDLDQLGRGSVWRGEFSPCIHQNHVFVVRSGARLLSDYLGAWTSGAAARRYFMVAGKQTTNLASINKTALGQLPVALPPLAEQQAIANALGDSDALIKSLEDLLAKKRQVKRGAIRDLLTGKRRLPGFSGKWEVKRLGTTAILKARIGWQGLTTAEYRESGDYYLVTGTEFNEGYIDWSNCHYVDESRYKQDKHIQLRERDVLVTKDGTIGKVALVTNLPGPATLNSGVFVIRPVDDTFHPEFFYYLLCSNVFTEFLSQLSAGSTINHLYQKDFVGFIYRTPPSVEEQIAIATVLFDMDSEIAVLEAKLAKARLIKQSMMQELLTGRIRLL